MKLYTKMPEGLRPHYFNELNIFHFEFRKKNFQLAWRHLERAHILGQSYPLQHTAVHWKMLKFGIHIKNWHEVLGQIPRLLIGGVKSFVGRVPIGNTGGANVPPLLPMEIPEDLLVILNKYK